MKKITIIEHHTKKEIFSYKSHIVPINGDIVFASTIKGSAFKVKYRIIDTVFPNKLIIVVDIVQA